MLGFLKTRRGLATGAAVIVAGLVLTLMATTSDLQSLLGGATPGADGGPAGSAPASASMQPAPAPAQSAADQSSPTKPSSDGTPAATGPAQQNASTNSASTSTSPASTSPGTIDAAAGSDVGPKPTFDIVRIEPTGDSVIAARGMPNADVVLLDGGTPIAHATSDANGQVALLPPPLKPGEHSLMLTMKVPGKPEAVSSQSIVVSVPEQPKTAAMVALIQPNQPASILSGPVAGSGSPAGQDAAGTQRTDTQSAPPVAIRSVEVEGMGSFYATGRAAPGSHCRIYLNGSLVATVTADGQGVWSLQIKRGMKPGKYAVRADQVEVSTGKVTARAEVPFDYPKSTASSLRKGLLKSTLPNVARNGTPNAPASHSAGGAKTAAAPASKSHPSDPKGQGSAQVASTTLPQATGAAGSAGPGDAATPTVIAELVTAKVIRGDSLWQISRKVLGQGYRYTQIYAANAQQIKDPRLIYPGQIFVLPQTGAL